MPPTVNMNPCRASIPNAGACSWRWPGRVVERRTRGGVVLLWLVMSLACGCQAPAEDQSAEFFVFGTHVEVQVRDATRVAVDEAWRELNRELVRMHREWHPWEPGALMELNQALAAGRETATTRDLVELIEAARRLERQSDGYFNPAIGALVSLWGFHTSDYPITRPPPEPMQVAELLSPHPSMAGIRVEGLRVTSEIAGLRLDFSGLAKGLAVRQACRILDRHGITEAMINAGGDVMICAASTRPWRIGIRDPRGGVLTTLALDEPVAVFTSGNYYRHGEFQGRRYGHVLNPHTGFPVDEILQVTVIDADPLKADAGATALVAAGIGNWRSIATRMGLERVMLVDAQGRVLVHEGRSEPPGSSDLHQAREGLE